MKELSETHIAIDNLDIYQNWSHMKKLGKNLKKLGEIWEFDAIEISPRLDSPKHP